MITHTEVQPEVALREIASPAPDFIALRKVASGDLHTRVQGQSVAPARQFETDPVISLYALRTPNARLAFKILDYHLLEAVVKQISDCQPAAYSRETDCRASLIADVAECTVSLI